MKVDKIRIRRGLKVNLPDLDEGEFGFCTDTKELFIGSKNGNVLYPNQSKWDELKGLIDAGNQDIETLFTDVNEQSSEITAARGTHSNLSGRFGSVESKVEENNNRIGTLSNLKTTNKTSLVNAINEHDTEIGDLSNLTTTNKTSLVNAVNEHDTEIGTISNLTTTDKTNLVAAVNENVSKIDVLLRKSDNAWVDVDENFKIQTPETDDTARIQRAIDSLVGGNGVLYFRKKEYIVNGQLQIKEHGLALLGVSGKNGTGTIFKTTQNNSNLSVLKIQRPTSGNIQGTRIENISFLGSTNFAVGTNSVDRPCIEMVDTYRLHMNKVAITGFLRQALLCNKVFDSNFIDVQVHYCGTDSLYPAIELTGTGGVNTNATHWFGLYAEYCPFFLRIDALSRHNQFVACKFERGRISYTGNAIHITSTANENVFIGCQFVSNEQTPLGKAHFFKIDNNYTKITDSMFTSEFATGEKWIKHTGTNGTITGNTFNQCFAEEYPFDFNDKVVFKDNDIFINVSNSKKYLITARNKNIIKDNQVMNKGAETAITEGVIFNLTGTRNNIKDNIVDGSVFKLYTATSSDNVFQRDSQDLITLTVGSATPSVAGGSAFVTANTSAVTITDFADAYKGQRITIIFGDGVTTISGAKFKLKGAAPVVGNGGGDTVEFIYNGTTFYEIARSDNT